MQINKMFDDLRRWHSSMVDVGMCFITHAHGGRGIMVFSAVGLFAFPHDVWKINAARITELDTEVFHDESWKYIFRGQKVKGQGHESPKNIAGVGLCTVVSASCLLLVGVGRVII